MRRVSTTTIAYVIPVGVPPHIAQKMMEASRAFRMFDVDHSGTISQKEMNRLFFLIDTDKSGRINEREFCEWYSFSY
ncbi:hypothetical protein H8356DRAFT_1436407 [Neocallimastix lanati (nom. inval.)]|nr:hypothetical protein H8356DRAFT_1436407 [Neocallimastix sp. JGI-2020a]